MNPVAVPPSRPPRRILRWLLVAAGLCLVPIFALGLVVASCFFLDRDAAALRRELGAGSSGWSTKVQVSVGRPVVELVRLGLVFAHNRDLRQASLALGAVHRASVGVYARDDDAPDGATDRFVAADRVMSGRGWVRMVGVHNPDECVLIYAPRHLDDGDPVDLCVAVMQRREMVVVTTTVDPAALADFLAQVGDGGRRGHLRLGSFKL